VDAVFIGRERSFNRRFLQMCSHYLVELVACTPASGWEKGQVENQVGVIRERFFKPRIRFASYGEMNGWLLDKCVTYARSHPHPELRDSPVWDVFETERSSLIPYVGMFDGLHAKAASVSKTCLVHFDNNKYSVMAQAVGRPVEIHAYADRITVRQDGQIVHVASGGSRPFTTLGTMCRCLLVSWCDAQRCTVQGLGVTRSPRPHPSQALIGRGR
jgi:hypothetical protein